MEEKSADSQDARIEEDEDLVSDAESSVCTEDVMDAVGLSSVPRIRIWLDLPPWLAALSLALAAHVLTTVIESSRCR
jgi:hypothetical protein